MAARILFVVFLLPALGSIYITWLTWRAGDDSKWLFTVFTVFFLLLASTPLLPKPKKKPETTSTRFVPHWFMMLAILAIVLMVLAAIVGAFVRR
jgi:hypothetical protein